MRRSGKVQVWAVIPMALVAAIVVAGCGQDILIGGGVDAAVGEWNGLHASLVVEKSGGAIEYDCAHGGFGSGVRPDPLGQFAVTGVFVREHGGPIWEGEVPDTVPALYLGTVRGDELTLRMVVGTDTAGPYILKRNGQVRLTKCL